MEDARAQRQRIAMLQFSLMWRVWVDKLPTDQEELLRVLMQLIVGGGRAQRGAQRATGHGAAAGRPGRQRRPACAPAKPK